MANPGLLSNGIAMPLRRCSRTSIRLNHRRFFHASGRRDVIKPFLLADIGEGTRECQIIQWFVKPGARVEQFDKLCEVQSDKTASDITSPFDGVIKKLYYEPDDMAIVGKPLLDIDIQSEISAEDEALLDTSAAAKPAATESNKELKQDTANAERLSESSRSSEDVDSARALEKPRALGKHQSLATPAVRHLTKELNIKIEDVEGTGKDGRVLKEDVQRHASNASQPTSPSPAPPGTQQTGAGDRQVALTPVQSAMFKTMTRSLTIPHFLYTSTVDMTALTALRQRLNRSRDASAKLTPLPFVMKAVSLALAHHPLLNAALRTADPRKPELTYHAAHHFGVAVDTPSGLMVPVVRNVEAQTIAAIAAQIRAISATAREGKLAGADLQGATFSVSNIGSIGGGVVAPIIVEPQVAIVGVGRSRIVPAFDEDGNVVKREELVLSWSADHRVVDGAECARCAERVKTYLERIEELVLEMR
ncbi:hypothetical protein MBLNU459_g6462t1 [Dothideomycetes sp. NU459]